jgi:tetratricopeptide (TPR) repeat protein
MAFLKAAWYDRAVEVLTAAHRRNPDDSLCRHRCGVALGNRAMAWAALNDYRKSLADWDLLIKIVRLDQAGDYLFYRIMTLTQLGEHRRAVEDVRKFLQRAGTPQNRRYHCGCVLSHLLEAAESDQRLTKEERAKAADSYTAFALEVLTQLRHDGYFRNPKMWLELVTEKDMTALRERPEFKHWLLKQLGW